MPGSRVCKYAVAIPRSINRSTIPLITRRRPLTIQITPPVTMSATATVTMLTIRSASGTVTDRSSANVPVTSITTTLAL